MNKQKTSKKETKQKKPSLITYDFTGEVIKIKGMQPTNLVRASLHAAVDNNIQLNTYRSGNSKEVTTINTSKIPKDANRKKWSEQVEAIAAEPEEIPAPLNDLPM